MREAGYGVAVLGAARPLGRTIRSVLRERAFPVREWRLFDSAEGIVEDTEEEREVPLIDIEAMDLAGIDLVFLCDGDAGNAERVQRLGGEEATIIDVSDALAQRSEVPLLVPEVNAAVITDVHATGAVACPVPGAIALSVVLKPIEERAGLRRVVVACYESVSGLGERAVEELARQSRELLSGRSVEPSVLPRRIAFNVIPQLGAFVVGAKARGEWSIESQTQRLLDLPDLPITVTGVRVPAFYGQGYAVNVETEHALDVEEASALLRESPGIVLLDDPPGEGYATLIEALETDATCVGRVRADPTVPSGLNLWVTIDGARKGGAVNAVQIAEILVRGTA
jgi:aspartate-semialdehyde dehydrogenase